MKKKLMLSCMLILFMLFSACKKNNLHDVSISYGTSFGMCAGYCSKSMEINDQKVTFSKSKYGATPDTKTCSKIISKTEVDEIIALLQNSKIETFPKVIGCPDCADGGAEWIEVNTNGQKRKVVFDYKGAPATLKPLADKLSTIAASFDDCN